MIKIKLCLLLIVVIALTGCKNEKFSILISKHISYLFAMIFILLSFNLKIFF